MAKKKSSKKGSSALPWMLLLLSLGAGGYYFYTQKQTPRLIPVGEILERCYQLHKNEKVEYHFKGEDIVSFDIRRGGDSLMAPRMLPYDEGSFVADSDGEYCLRFGNALTRPQAIEYNVKRLK